MNIVRRSCQFFSRVYYEGNLFDPLSKANFLKLSRVPDACSKSLHTTAKKCDLMEFFDDEKNWGTQSVKVGRSWKKEELRIKSNSDLHKLWYILLKERNMLMSMEHEYKEAFEAFPNPERLDKVKESMHNLEEVVIERNKAYHELETGETGIRPAKQVINQLGLPQYYKMTEHLVPKFVNKKWRETHKFYDIYKETNVFHALLKEKQDSIARARVKGMKHHILALMRRFPNMDLEAVKAKYPEVGDAVIDKLKASDKARGHWLP